MDPILSSFFAEEDGSERFDSAVLLGSDFGEREVAALDFSRFFPEFFFISCGGFLPPDAR